MGNVQEIATVNWFYIFTSIVLLLVVFCFVVDTIVKVCSYVKKPMDWKKRNDDDHKIVEKLSETISELKKQQDIDREQSIKHDNAIKDDLVELSDMVFDKNIEDMRWRILDFSSAISNGRKFNRESYDFIIRTYQQYEELLKKKNKTNGLIEETIKYIKSDYQEKLKEGNF